MPPKRYRVEYSKYNVRNGEVDDHVEHVSATSVIDAINVVINNNTPSSRHVTWVMGLIEKVEECN